MPSTIDGYRSAIADKQGNSPINVSKDENLTHLLDSLHRHRPKRRRGIPSWNLSLLLYQLTKAPFEPIKEASLKNLTFMAVFLLGFYPTALKGCRGIVFTHGVRMGGRAGVRAGGRAAVKSLSGLYLRNRNV